MAKNSCVYFPRGKYKEDLFLKLKADFGYNDAAYIFNKVTHPSFIEANKDSLVINEGVPTYESVMANDAVINFIGRDNILKAINSRQPHLENNLENAALLINQAHLFNMDEGNKGYIAYVDYDNDDKLTLSIVPRSSENIDVSENQFRIQKLNERISEMLSPIGITMGTLSEEEVAIGRVGVTNFNRAVDTANGLATMMAIANNLEGYKAISEEFSHFIVGVYRNSSLVSRSINALKNEDVAKAILGDRYEEISAFYNGNSDMIAEEALGHVLRDTLLNIDTPANINKGENKYKSLFRRAIDFIVRLFKGYNPSYIQSSIDFVNANMGELARELMEDKKTLTKQDVAASQREAVFNALSERAEAQIEVLKGIEERAYKNIHLQQDLENLTGKSAEYKGKASKLATNIHKILKTYLKEEETMAAISSLLKLSMKDLSKLYADLNNIENLTTADKFILLRNVLYTLQSYQPTIKELKDITESSYLEDEHIKGQKFVIGDAALELKEFEAENELLPVDTSGMSSSEVVSQIIKDSGDWALSSDESFYINKKTGEKGKRVTSLVTASNDETFDSESPWYIPSTNIGTGIDEFVRDFIGGKIKKVDGKYTVDGKSLSSVYPNATEDSLNSLAESLGEFVQQQQSRGITLVPRDITVNGTITSVDNQGRPHTINAAGTLDLLGYDRDGNWYVYDIKTFRSDIDSEKEDKYAQQVTLYKDFLEKKYGIKVKEVAILPIKVSYPTPKGFGKGKVVYTVDSRRPEGYNGKKGNQLKVDGKTFRAANPVLQSLRTLTPRKTTVSYGQLGGEQGSANISATLEAITAVDRVYTQIGNLFNEVAPKYLADYFRAFIGDNIKVREVDKETGKPTGKLVEVSIEKLIEEAPKDSNLVQRWLLTMADNPDAYLQIFAKIHSIAKNEKRLKMIAKAQEIYALGRQYEKLGITSYDWMFEEDKKNYILHFVVNGKDYSYDKAAYEKAKAEYIKVLDEKYGQFPEVGSDAYTQKNEALIKWMDDNTIPIETYTVGKKGQVISHVKIIPSPTIYPSRYNSLSDVQKEFYHKWMALKEELDSYLPKDVTTTTNTIKIRKSGYERLTGALHGNVLNNFLEGVKARFLQSFDDENNYSRGIKGFMGEEVMRLPLLYINANETEDITTDVIGSLIAYADMAYNYEAMNNIVNPLEIGRFLAQNRKVHKLKNGKRAFEEFSFGTVSIKNPLFEDNTSNFMGLLNDFMESKIYDKHLKDAGSFEVKGKQVDKQKLASEVLKLGSAVQLGFNALAGMANVATGVSMQRIEAIAGEFFNIRELAKADTEFVKASASFVGDIGQRIKKSKLALFDELFDVRQDFSKKIRHENFKNRNLLLRIFGPNIQYICQDSGDHWLYNRSAIAIALRYKLKDGNNEISLWDALETVPVDPENPEAGNKLVIKEGVTKLDGTPFTNKDISEISDRIKYINQHCFGVYNQEDAVAARRTILGRFLMQYRDWIPAQMNYRFGVRTTNLNKGEGEETEGYYRTFGRLIINIVNELRNGEHNVKQCFDELDDYEKANIKRAVAELVQLAAVYLIAGLLKGSKKKDRKYSWARNTLGYLFTREKTELGALVPLTMPGELLNIVKSPFAATSVVSDLYNLRLLLDPRNYTDEIQSGTFKGHSSAYRAFMRSPLTLYYRTLNRQLEPQKAEQFYK